MQIKVEGCEQHVFQTVECYVIFVMEQNFVKSRGKLAIFGKFPISRATAYREVWLAHFPSSGPPSNSAPPPKKPASENSNPLPSNSSPPTFASVARNEGFF